MSGLATWASPIPGDTGLTWASLDLVNVVLTSSHPELVNLVTTWASPSPGDFVPHLDLIAVDTFLASPGSGNSDPNWASPRSGDSGPHRWTIMTWILCPTPEPHLDMMTLDPLWVSP